MYWIYAGQRFLSCHLGRKRNKYSKTKEFETIKWKSFKNKKIFGWIRIAQPERDRERERGIENKWKYRLAVASTLHSTLTKLWFKALHCRCTDCSHRNSPHSDSHINYNMASNYVDANSSANEYRRSNERL